MKKVTFTPPPGGDRDHGWALLSVTWAFQVFAVATTILRIFVRSRITRNLGWDDYNIVAAQVTNLIGAGLVTAGVLNGLGRHEYYLTAAQQRNFVILGWVDWIQTFITLMFTKISICLFILRIVSTKYITGAMHGLIACLVLSTAVCVFLFLGICRPLKAYWDVGVDGVCLSRDAERNIIMAQGVFSIITDLICAAFPIFILRKLQIHMRTKIGLCSLMGLGVVVAVCCFVRTVLSSAVTKDDLSWTVVANVAWRLPEVIIGIVCANVPVLRPLYLFYRGRLRLQTHPKSAASNDRLWPNSKHSQGVQFDKSTKSSKKTKKEHTGHTSVSVEMGLPMQGDEENGKKYSRYLSLESRESDKSAEVWSDRAG